MRQIFLHGHLKKKFGAKFNFEVATAGEAIRALNCAFPGKFIDALRHGSYQLIRGRRHGGMSIDLDDINTFKLGEADLHIVPAIHGSKNKGGTIKAVIGVAIVGAAIFASGGTLAAPLAGMAGIVPGTAILGSAGISWGTIALFGLGMSLAGAASMLAKSDTKPGDNASVDPQQSFSLSGPLNINEQGTAVPLIYGGPIIVGSQPISAGFDIENIGAYSG